MANEIPGFLVGTQTADADYSTKQFYCVAFSATGVVLCSAAGQRCDGILQNDPVSGECASVMTDGVSKAVASGTLAKGSLVTTDAAGKLKAAVLGRTDTSDAGGAVDALLGSNILGVLLEASSADGDIVTLLIQKVGAAPTTAS